jgi:Fe-S-cluster containining protein
MNINEIELAAEISQKIAGLYAEMEETYDKSAKAINLTCMDCPDNCCDSYFLHHTYTEWAYLWEGLNKLGADKLAALQEKAREYVLRSETILARGERPMLMCPLNEAGLCTVYLHRMMICRLHGVPAAFKRPDGQAMQFPGCFRCQEITRGKTPAVSMDRTDFFRRLVELELGLLGQKRFSAPKVKLTLAQMIVQGPPQLPL